MYIDYDLKLSNAQAITSSTNSTNYIDSIQSGWGANDEVYARFMVQTAFAGSAGSSITLAIQIAQDTAFGTVINAVQITKGGTSDLTLKAIPLVVKLPVSMMTGQTGGDTLYNPNNLPYRYLRAYYTVTFPSFSAGNITCALVMNEPTTIDKPM